MSYRDLELAVKEIEAQDAAIEAIRFGSEELAVFLLAYVGDLHSERVRSGYED